jgi:hypothetical protein
LQELFARKFSEKENRQPYLRIYFILFQMYNRRVGLGFRSYRASIHPSARTIVFGEGCLSSPSLSPA